MQDKVMPTGAWEFDENVTACFDDMLSRSIPDYEEMRSLVLRVGTEFVQHRTEIVDLGCSRGAGLEPFVRKFGAFNHYIGVEISPPMLAASRERFAGLVERNIVDIQSIDLRHEYPPVAASLTLCCLTLQFTPIEYRQQILKSIFRSTLPGGALILVEKIIGCSAEIDSILVKLHLRHKEDNGYSKDAIDRKRLSLEGVLVPITAAWNEQLVRTAGFSQVEMVWRNLNFAAWVAVRNEV
jgi:tRNA (cmo5U34)-methyltransferase